MQHHAALAAIERNQAEWPQPIVTTIELADRFWPAEDYHQEYWEGDGQRNPYCIAHIPPKLQKLRKRFADRATESATARESVRLEGRRGGKECVSTCRSR